MKDFMKNYTTYIMLLVLSCATFGMLSAMQFYNLKQPSEKAPLSLTQKVIAGGLAGGTAYLAYRNANRIGRCTVSTARWTKAVTTEKLLDTITYLGKSVLPKIRKHRNALALTATGTLLLYFCWDKIIPRMHKLYAKLFDVNHIKNELIELNTASNNAVKLMSEILMLFIKVKDQHPDYNCLQDPIFDKAEEIVKKRIKDIDLRDIQLEILQDFDQQQQWTLETSIYQPLKKTFGSAKAAWKTFTQRSDICTACNNISSRSLHKKDRMEIEYLGDANICLFAQDARMVLTNALQFYEQCQKNIEALNAPSWILSIP
jgi:hypothetical protein